MKANYAMFTFFKNFQFYILDRKFSLKKLNMKFSVKRLKESSHAFLATDGDYSTKS
jgi:hypothetical protein